MATVGRLGKSLWDDIQVGDCLRWLLTFESLLFYRGYRANGTRYDGLGWSMAVIASRKIIRHRMYISDPHYTP